MKWNSRRWWARAAATCSLVATGLLPATATAQWQGSRSVRTFRGTFPAQASADVQSLANLSPAQRRALRMDVVVRAVLRARPSVVAIATMRTVKETITTKVGEEETGRQYTQTGVGSGVIVHSKGYVVTNEHVIRGAKKIWVRLSDGRVLKARVMGTAEVFDLAVLKVETTANLPVAAMGESDGLFHGETVIAIGTPFGLTTTVSRGVISALKRRFAVKDRYYAEFLQTDAAVNPGNSGGPLVNVLGEVVAINTAVHKGGPGIGFAIPVDRVKRVLRDLMTYGYVRGIYLGLSVRKHRDGGVLVTAVDPGSPAAAAGIRTGEIILKVLDQETNNPVSFDAMLNGLVSGRRISILLKGRKVEVVPTMLTPIRARHVLEHRVGFKLGNAARYVSRMRLTARAGAVVLDVRYGSPASQAGIRTGDVIVEAGGYEVHKLNHMSYVAARLKNQRRCYFHLKRGSRVVRVWVNF